MIVAQIDADRPGYPQATGLGELDGPLVASLTASTWPSMSSARTAALVGTARQRIVILDLPLPVPSSGCGMDPGVPALVRPTTDVGLPLLPSASHLIDGS
jgi:hypothetical protein